LDRLSRWREDSQKWLSYLFEPFVEVDALEIFPGSAGQVVEVAGEHFGIYV
jgi:hypothetical protein